MAEQKRMPPVKRIRTGNGVAASIWENEGEKDGRSFVRRSVSIQKRYCDDKGNWHSSSSFSKNELPAAILALQKAYEHLTLSPEREDEPEETE